MSQTQGRLPTQELGQEHLLVKEKLRQLTRGASLLAQPEAGSHQEGIAALKEAAAFLAQELELHLKKEEEALFPPLEAIMGTEGGPTAAMRAEHVDIRARNQELQGTVALLSGGGPIAMREVQNLAHYISNLLGQHIDKEDHILFPLAEEMLEPPAMEGVAAAMRALEARVGE